MDVYDGCVNTIKILAQTDAIKGLALAWSQLKDDIRPGQTEKQVARRLRFLLKKAGFPRPAFRFIVASGPNAAQPHHAPTNRSLGSNEPVKIDFGVRHRGWRTDVTRTVFLGRPTAFQKKIYSLVLKAQAAAVRRLRPDADTLRVDAAARRVITRAGYGRYFVHSTGHAVGHSIHERPFLSPKPKSRSTLRVGDVVTVEPGVYLPGRFGIRIEDMYLINRTGCRCLTTGLPKKLTEVVWTQ